MIVNIKSICLRCDGNEFIINIPNYLGYQQIICKECGLLDSIISDNGNKVNILIPKINYFAAGCDIVR